MPKQSRAQSAMMSEQELEKYLNQQVSHLVRLMGDAYEGPRHKERQKCSDRG
jgi:hypothetical protein